MLIRCLMSSRFNVYTKVAEQITAAQAIIMNKAHAAAEIDRILARPVYLTLPMDLTTEKISAKRLRIKLPRTPP
ncbi:hypothetical protein C8R48DRAFT_561222, partial [Suillus tomentosus]